MINNLFELIRIKSWVKNGFIFIPIFFSLNLFNANLFLIDLIAFISFSLCCSSIYVVNDLIDYNRDKSHPRKKHRVLPSGRISKRFAILIAFVLLIGSISISFVCRLNKYYLYILISYLLLNLIYSIYLKKVNIIEMVCISFNFVLRVFAGCFVISVNPSKWIIVVTFFLSLFLVLIKRKSEINLLKDKASIHREVLKFYTKEVLDKFIFISATIILASYLLYTMDDFVIRSLGSDYIFYTVLFVLIGVFRFIQLSDNNEYMGEGDPTILLYKDRYTQINLIAWFLSLLFLIYV
jgi:decaprenyl-phosphate phosphoribosyltransferase